MAVREERRPDPEELLRRIEAAERRERRGRLKIFLGYASRVGKSFRMFDEGRRRKQRGEDVVVAALQPVIPPNLEPLLATLEVIPPANVLDLPALLKRHPEVCVIDPLAFDNPPGSRHPHRWQDIEEILEHGIAVITAVNLQHISGPDLPASRAPSIPVEFLRAADEIEVVDAPPDALVGRTGEGAIPDPRRLAELREQALLLAADVVERELLEYLDVHGIKARAGAQERILVCLTPRSSARAMLESGRRNARRFHGALLAATVEQSCLTPQERERLEAHLDFARELGAEVHRLKGSDFVSTILDFARQQRITQIFVGHSLAEPKFAMSRDPIERLLDGAIEFDVRLFPHPEAS